MVFFLSASGETLSVSLVSAKKSLLKKSLPTSVSTPCFAFCFLPAPDTVCHGGIYCFILLLIICLSQEDANSAMWEILFMWSIAVSSALTTASGTLKAPYAYLLTKKANLFMMA